MSTIKRTFRVISIKRGGSGMELNFNSNKTRQQKKMTNASHGYKATHSPLYSSTRFFSLFSLFCLRKIQNIEIGHANGERTQHLMIMGMCGDCECGNACILCIWRTAKWQSFVIHKGEYISKTNSIFQFHSFESVFDVINTKPWIYSDSDKVQTEWQRLERNDRTASWGSERREKNFYLWKLERICVEIGGSPLCVPPTTSNDAHFSHFCFSTWQSHWLKDWVCWIS